MKYLGKRTWLGALLFLIFVGEPTVGLHTGLFTPPGLIILGSLYVVLFLLYEALIVRYRLGNWQVVLLTFAIYAVGVTGLLHGEIADYTLHPQRTLITTMIRLQCSLFVPFAYYFLNRVVPRDLRRVMSVKKALLVTVIYVLLMSLSGKFGLPLLFKTLHEATFLSVVFIAAATVAVLIALRPIKLGPSYSSKSLTFWTWVLLIVGAIPNIVTLILLLIIMPIVTLFYALKPEWRRAAL